MGLGTVVVAGSAQSPLWVLAALKFSPEKSSVVKQDMPWRLRASLGWVTLEKGCFGSSESLWGSSVGPDLTLHWAPSREQELFFSLKICKLQVLVWS